MCNEIFSRSTYIHTYITDVVAVIKQHNYNSFNKLELNTHTYNKAVGARFPQI